MATAVFVIDTSYLCELFAVPGCSTPVAIIEVRRRFREAAETGGRLYVTLPAIFEVAGHIANVADGRVRRELSEKLRDAVVGSIDQTLPWNLLPSLSNEAVKQLLAAFVEQAGAGMSFVDITLVDEARRLRQTTYRGPAWRVHIWTKDREIKAWEPDNESNAFLG